MTDTILLNLRDVKRAYAAESGKLRNGEPSRFLPDYTNLQVTPEPGEGYTGAWNIHCTLTRISDGKVYGHTHRGSLTETREVFHSLSHDPNETILFTEKVARTRTIVYYENA